MKNYSVISQGKEAFYDSVMHSYKKNNEEARAKNQHAPGIPILTYSTLRLELPISATVTEMIFPVLDGVVAPGAASQFPNEIRLQQNDNFHIDTCFIGMTQLVAATDTNYRIKTYPNEVELGAANVNDYFNFYNGRMKINVNQVDVLTNWDVEKHLVIPQTQRLSVAANTNRDQYDAQADGVVEMRPSIMLSGAYTNTVTINLNAAVATALAGGLTRAVIIFRGLRAQNAAIRK